MSYQEKATNEANNPTSLIVLTPVQRLSARDRCPEKVSGHRLAIDRLGLGLILKPILSAA